MMCRKGHEEDDETRVSGTKDLQEFNRYNGVEVPLLYFAVGILLIINVFLIIIIFRMNRLLKPLREQQGNLIGFVREEAGKLEERLVVQINVLEKKQRQLVEIFDAELNKAIQKQKGDFEIAFKREKDRQITYLKNQVTDFKVLMDNEYLAQYEKMKKNPPKPKKGPRKRAVEPPKKYRSIDDE